MHNECSVDGQHMHNKSGYYLMQTYEDKSDLLTRESWLGMLNSKHAQPRFAGFALAVQFDTIEDAHEAFRQCAQRLVLRTMPVKWDLRSVTYEEAFNIMVGQALSS